MNQTQTTKNFWQKITRPKSIVPYVLPVAAILILQFGNVIFPFSILPDVEIKNYEPSDHASILETLHKEAYQHIKEKKFDDALWYADLSIKKDPSYALGWIDRGMAFMGIGNCTEAVAAVYHANMLEPDAHNQELLSSVEAQCRDL